MASVPHTEGRPTRQRTFLVAVAGNPNCGKTTIFNALTGLRHRVGNYSGVTVEKREGFMTSDADVRLLDLPGTYSLMPHSPDERVARDVLLGHEKDTPRPDAVLIVIDASNLERNLYLATQIAELGLPAVVACNMMDVVTDAGHRLDTERLSRDLGLPVVPTVGARGEGITELRAAIRLMCRQQDAGTTRRWRSDEAIEREIRSVASVLTDESGHDAATAETLAVLALSDGEGHHLHLPYEVSAAARESRHRLSDGMSLDAARELTVARYTWIRSVAHECLSRSDIVKASLTDRLDRVLTHSVWGLTIFAPMMALLFYSIFVLATPLMDLIDSGVTAARAWIIGGIQPGVLRDLLTDGVVAGVGNVLVFFPQICILFLFIALLEDSGYMARAAFLMNRIMSRVGLHGKSFIPLLSSHACAVPGIMAARTIENPRDRLVTILVAPLMGCSARLPVYTLLIAACLPVSAWIKAVALLTMYGLGVAAALAMAMLFKRTLLAGPVPAFVIELPPYRWPKLTGVLGVMWDRSKLFLTQAGTIILAMTIVLWGLMNYPVDRERMAWYDAQVAALRSTGDVSAQPELAERVSALEQRAAAERLANSAVGRVGHFIEPALRPLGYDWKIGVGVVASLAAREVFVSTMGVVYSVGEAEADSKTLRQELAEARWPDGRRVFTPLVAVGLMVFYVLACQCMSTLAVVKRETASWRWPLFMFAYMSVLAYVAALLVYQIGSLLGIGTA